MPLTAWRGGLLALSAVATTALAGPVSAGPCTDEIAGLSKRVDEQARTAISASSSGQGDAAARGGQGTTGAPDGGTSGPPQAPAQASAKAGEGADKAQAAKVALDEARTRDDKGDAAGCREAVGRATKALDTAP